MYSNSILIIISKGVLGLKYYGFKILEETNDIQSKYAHNKIVLLSEKRTKLAHMFVERNIELTIR